MKAILVLCLLFAATFAAKKQETTKLGLALKSFAQLAQDDEVDQVEAILQEVRAEVQADYDALVANYEADEETFNAALDEANGWLDEISAGLAYYNEERNDWSRISGELQEDIANNLASIADSESQIDSITAQRQADHDAFTARVDGLQEAIEAAQEALQLVIEIGSQDLAATLIQINNKKISKNFEAIHAKISKHAAGTVSHSMAQILLEAADSINEDVAGQLVDLIENLIDTLNQEVSDAVAAENGQAQAASDAIDGLNGVIAAQTDAANSNQAALDEAEAIVAADEEAIANLEYWQGFINDAVAAATADWEARTDNYEKLRRRLQRDLDALDEAQSVLEGN